METAPPRDRSAADLTTRLKHGTRGLAFALLFLAGGPACAHRTTPVGATTGLPLPSVSHGQMVVLDANRAAVMSLADAQYPTDGEMRQLQAFVALQYFYCAWGAFPGSLSDESSPFNECTHAYLAGVRALLVHLESMPGDRAPVRALRRKIDLEMLEHQAAMVLCRFSEEPFNTADVVAPRVLDVLANPSSLLVLLSLAAAAAGCGGATSMLASRVRGRADGSSVGRLAEGAS